jgi:hypothetical protein
MPKHLTVFAVGGFLAGLVVSLVLALAPAAPLCSRYQVAISRERVVRLDTRTGVVEVWEDVPWRPFGFGRAFRFGPNDARVDFEPQFRSR